MIAADLNCTPSWLFGFPAQCIVQIDKKTRLQEIMYIIQITMDGHVINVNVSHQDMFPRHFNDHISKTALLEKQMNDLF